MPDLIIKKTKEENDADENQKIQTQKQQDVGSGKKCVGGAI